MPVSETEGIDGDVRNIQEFREWGRCALDAGRGEPAWDAGMDPHSGC